MRDDVMILPASFRYCSHLIRAPILNTFYAFYTMQRCAVFVVLIFILRFPLFFWSGFVLFGIQYTATTVCTHSLIWNALRCYSTRAITMCMHKECFVSVIATIASMFILLLLLLSFGRFLLFPLNEDKV